MPQRHLLQSGLRAFKVGEDLVDNGGLLPALHRHRVHRPVHEVLPRGRVLDGFGAGQGPRAIPRVQGLQPGGQVDGVSQDAVLHAVLGADVPGEGLARVDADTALHGDLPPSLHGHRRQPANHAVDFQRGGHGGVHVVLQEVRRVEHREDLVTDELQEGTPPFLDDVRDLAQHPRKQGQHLLRCEVAASILEVLDVAEEDADVALRNADGGLDARAEEPLHHARRHVHGPGPDGAAHGHESFVQLLQLMDFALRPAQVGWHVPVNVQDLQGGHCNHVVGQ
mmetsp:Transcript_106673/g.296905  ORF Transcript_106673/g.296905 Transcript_106673/m.296905 type:complete len:280 (+) Transcript_106673:643-1482(+)